MYNSSANKGYNNTCFLSQCAHEGTLRARNILLDSEMKEWG